MKSTYSLRSFLALAGSVILVATQAQANNYWDSNGNTAGLGDTAGTWGSTAAWGGLTGGDSRSVLLGTRNTANTTIAVGSTVYFGTLNLALGSTGSTISITGAGVQANRIVFGLGQGAQGVTLSGGGGDIKLTNGSASIIANNTGINTIGAVLINDSTPRGLLYGGSGTTVLTGANTFTGGITVTSGGTLQIGDGTSGSLTSQNLTFHTGGGTFNVRAADTGSTQSMGTLTFTNTGTTVGEGTVQSTYGTSGNAELSFTSLAARGAGATGNFIVSGGSNGTTNKIVLTGAATGFLDRGLYFGGSSYAAYDAGGFVRGLIYGTDTNTVATNTITAGNHVQLTNTQVNQNTISLLSLNLAGSGVDYFQAAGQTLTVPGILKTGGGSSEISGGTSLTTASNAELVIRTDSASDALTISTGITGFSGGLTKTGAGTLTLSGTNGYTGATRINAGTLAVGGGSAIADNQGVILANAAGATFQLDNDETILNVTGGGFYGGNVNVQSNTLTLSSNAGYTFGGQFIGMVGGGVVKQGNGTLILQNTNTFAGNFTLAGGALEFQYGNDGTGAVVPLSSGGAFNMANGTTLRFRPQTNLAWGTFGAQIQASNGGSPSYPYGWEFANDINITDGTASFRVDGNENTIRFTGDVTGGASGSQTLAFFSGGIAVGSGDRQASTFAGTIQDGAGGTLGVNIDFAGASSTAQAAFVNLSGQNTFTGPLVVTNSKGLISGATTGGYVGIGGELYANPSSFATGNGYLGGGNFTNTISLAGGTTLVYLSSANQTLGGEISGDGALRVEAPANGILRLTTANTYTGPTTVNGGTLLIGSAGSTAAASAVSVASGASLGGDGTVGGSATFNNGSSFAWNVGDTFAVTGNLVDGGTAGGSVFKIMLAGSETFADAFWSTDKTWNNVLNSGNSVALESLFTSFSYENANIVLDPTAFGTFGLSGTTLTWTAVPEPSTALAGLLLGLGLLRRRRTA